MPAKLLVTSFKFSVSGAQYNKAASSLAAQFAAVPGLRWKIWTINEAAQEAGGIYLLDDEASLKALLDSPLMAQVMTSPVLSEFSVKQFDVMEGVTAITRGPIELTAQT